MRVYKATTASITCTRGSGTYQYQQQVPATAESSKCANRGLHACEYVLDCMNYYSLDGKNRFWLAEADGSIDEDGQDSRIACEKLTLIRELTRKEIVDHAITYMVRHPNREWQIHDLRTRAEKDQAEGIGDGIVIARGEHPIARGKKGDILGFLAEWEPGWFQTVARCEVDGERFKEDCWYSVLPDGRIAEVKRDED